MPRKSKWEPTHVTLAKIVVDFERHGAHRNVHAFSKHPLKSGSREAVQSRSSRPCWIIGGQELKGWWWVVVEGDHTWEFKLCRSWTESLPSWCTGLCLQSFVFNWSIAVLPLQTRVSQSVGLDNYSNRLWYSECKEHLIDLMQHSMSLTVCLSIELEHPPACLRVNCNV